MDNTFGITLITIFLTAYIAEAGKLLQTGILDDMPSNCTGMDYCFTPHPKYPHRTIDWLLTKKLQIELGNAREGEPRIREGDENSVASCCEKNETYGPIYEIVDETGTVRVVVQSHKFKQQIRVEKCTYPGKLNVGDTEAFGSEELETNEITCNEKKMEYSFLVLTRDGEGLESVKSRNGIPVCCSCRIENV